MFSLHLEAKNLGFCLSDILVLLKAFIIIKKTTFKFAKQNVFKILVFFIH